MIQVEIHSYSVGAYWLVAFLHPALLIVYFCFNRRLNFLKKRHFILTTFVFLVASKIFIGSVFGVDLMKILNRIIGLTIIESIVFGILWWLLLVKLNEKHFPYN